MMKVESHMKKIVIYCALLLLCSMTALAQNVSTERGQELELLRGIDAARVEIKSELKRPGFDVESLQETVEARLKRAGIRVLEPEESCRVVVSVLLTAHNNNSIVIRVQLRQIATLNRLDKIIFAPTWERLTVGAFGRQRLSMSVAKLLDELIADYISVNRPVTRLARPVFRLGRGLMRAARAALPA
jgi:hypothetical protein